MLGDDSVSPVQLVKLRRQTPMVQEQLTLPRHGGQDIAKQVLGLSPSPHIVGRLAEIYLKLQGSDVGADERGKIVIDGYRIQGSNLGTALRYLVKGLRGFKGVPSGSPSLETYSSNRGSLPRSSQKKSAPS